ncbi:hypothetical protein [Mycolicibacterium vulneris]|uniref:hypothetical protein n=1 Tax=Mycolicibacterium vulneris TaxID=547163 RepID=UPI0013FD384B|nr:MULTISPECIES: hypothetical protein [Mycobacteriaceae]MEA1161383.1 hypothetical protein [Mycobacterium europaeum]
MIDLTRGKRLRCRLRGSKTPVVIRDALPQTSTGKVLRRDLIADLLGAKRAATL